MFKLAFAYRIGYAGKKRERPRDVLVGFADWSMKAAVLDVLRDKPKISIEGQELSIFSDLCSLTLKRRRELRFLTTKLVNLGIPYKWGFPLKLLIEYQRQIVTIRTVQQATAFEAQ